MHEKISQNCSAEKSAICFEIALCAIPAVQIDKTGPEPGNYSNESTWRHIYQQCKFSFFADVLYILVSRLYAYLKEDFNSEENFARSTFYALFLLKCVH